ncbi:MAG: GatB/YqeY domain-containing protein [Patescibacteria group bacterium]|nr:GatB/YqeY domain-containing protein [Patescibacteria group bacterium]
MLEKIQNDLKTAMKKKDELTVLTLRQFIASLKNAQIAKKDELNETEIGSLALNEIKKRKDAIELYKQGKRSDLVEKEEKEIKILENYAPKLLDETKLGEIVEKTINELNATPANFGKVMGQVMQQTKGKADGTIVSEIVKQKLGI